jgi:hypothetical protein
VDWETIRVRMEKRRQVDPDIWLIEVEDRDGLGGVEIV